MSDLIRESPEKTHEGWKSWYLEQHPAAIDRAVSKIMPMIENMKAAADEIDETMVRNWVEDLVLTKTAEGLIIQEAVLKALASEEGTSWRPATRNDEAKGIDGYVGERPVSIKPESYLSKKHAVREQIPVEIVYYKKTSKYLHVYVKPD